MLMLLNAPPQDGGWMFNTPILFDNSLNLAPPKGLVSRSAAWSCDTVYSIFTSPAYTIILTKWQSISMWFFSFMKHKVTSYVYCRLIIVEQQCCLSMRNTQIIENVIQPAQFTNCSFHGLIFHFSWRLLWIYLSRAAKK